MIIFILIIFGLVLKTSYRKPNVTNKNYTFLFVTITIIHALSFLINHFYINAIDSAHFFQRALSSDSWFSLFGIGSTSMSFFVYPFTKLGCNYFIITLLCSIFSLKGYFIYLELISKKLKNFNIQHLLVIYLLISPSIHVWTTSLCKESLLFTLMAMVLKQLHNKRVFNIRLLLLVLFITLIRPYIALFVVASIIIVHYKVILKKYKVISVFSLSIITIALVNFSRVYNLSTFSSHFQKTITYSSNNGNSSIDLLSSNYFERLFLVLFRPFFIDSKTLFQFFVSIENFVFVILLIIFFYKMYQNKPKFASISNYVRITLIFSISCILFYSIYMYNLGLASRMRVMFIPFLLIGMFNLLSLKKI